MKRYATLNSYSNRPLMVNKSRVVAFTEHEKSTPENPMVMLFMATSYEASEEWAVRETVASVTAILEEE